MWQSHEGHRPPHFVAAWVEFRTPFLLLQWDGCMWSLADVWYLFPASMFIESHIFNFPSTQLDVFQCCLVLHHRDVSDIWLFLVFFSPFPWLRRSGDSSPFIEGNWFFMSFRAASMTTSSSSFPGSPKIVYALRGDAVLLFTRRMMMEFRLWLLTWLLLC